MLYRTIHRAQVSHYMAIMALLSPFPTMFSIHFIKGFCFLVTFILSSAKAFNLDKPKNLSYGKELCRDLSKNDYIVGNLSMELAVRLIDFLFNSEH